ncbi:MAG: ribosome-binding factor A [bacterium]
MSQRIQKVNELLRQEISKLLLQEVDFNDTLVTITNVDTSPDLRQSKIKISIIPEKNHEFVLEIIKRKIFHIQQKLNKKLYMRPIPKICFEIDKIEIKAQKIEELLGKMNKDILDKD